MIWNKLLQKKLLSYSVQLLPHDANFTIRPNQTLLEAALAAGIDFPFNCQVGSCKSCACRIKDGKAKPLVDLAYVFEKSKIEEGYTLACQTIPLSNITVVLERSDEQITNNCLSSIEAIYQGFFDLTSRVFKIKIRLNHELNVKPGQYVYVQIPELNTERPFSFASVEVEGNSCWASFDIARVPNGKVSSWLANRDNIGKHLNIRGPFGDFWLRDGDAPVLCIAGGSGMGAMLAIIKEACRSSANRKFIYVYGARCESDLYAINEIKSLINKSQNNIVFLPILSNEPETSDWRGLRGHIPELLLHLPTLIRNYPWRKVNARILSGWQCLLCGPPGLIDKCLPVLEDLGVDNGDVFFDKYIPQA